MTQESAWKLFFATGLPVAYLLAKQAPRGERTSPPHWAAAQPAFQGRALHQDRV